MKKQIKNIFNTEFKNKTVIEINNEINILQKEMIGYNGKIETQAPYNFPFWSSIVSRVSYLNEIKAITLKERRIMIANLMIDKR